MSQQAHRPAPPTADETARFGRVVGPGGYDRALHAAPECSQEARAMGNRWWAVLWLWLLPMRGEATASSDSEAPAPREPTRSGSSLIRLEVATLALLPRAGSGETESFVQLEPTLILDGGAEFGLNLGAPVRLRGWGGADGAGRVRREDWDSVSDWGQLVRGLKLGSDAAPVGVWLGALEDYSLLSAHLVRRYSNRTNPDYHPVGGFLTGTVGPLYTEAFASDVLGARLMGAEVALDVGRVLFGADRSPGRYSLAVSAVHDWGRAGGRAPSVTLAHLDGTAVVLRRPGLEAHLLTGWGGRPGVGGAWGAVLGMGADLGQPGARYLGAAEARWRVMAGKLYAVATGGTLLFPEGDGTLRPGAFASVGLGVDHAR